jgi:hypothetical protein
LIVMGVDDVFSITHAGCDELQVDKWTINKRGIEVTFEFATIRACKNKYYLLLMMAGRWMARR